MGSCSFRSSFFYIWLEHFLIKGSKKLLNAWAFYDWANSVYSLVISSAIFPIFYGALFRVAKIEKVVVFGGEIARAPLISYVTSAAFLFIALITPILSGISDYLGNKRLFMKLFCYSGSLVLYGVILVFFGEYLLQSRFVIFLDWWGFG